MIYALFRSPLPPYRSARRLILPMPARSSPLQEASLSHLSSPPSPCLTQEKTDLEVSMLPVVCRFFSLPRIVFFRASITVCSAKHFFTSLSFGLSSYSSHRDQLYLDFFASLATTFCALPCAKPFDIARCRGGRERERVRSLLTLEHTSTSALLSLGLLTVFNIFFISHHANVCISE